MSAEDETPRTRGKPFVKGQSGNPAGRPRGARNKATLAAEALLDGQVEALTAKLIELALAGNMVAMRLCMARLVPVTRDRSVEIDLPQVNTVADGQKAMTKIIASVARGEITPEEASSMANLIDRHRRGIDFIAKEATSQMFNDMFPLKRRTG